VHGGEFETSHMLFKRPELVRLDGIELSRGVYIDSRFVHIDHLAGGGKVMWITTWQDQLVVTPKGHVGDPARGDGRERPSGVEFIEDMRRFTGARHS
jgi:creatinine amidohydrolase/Fe(II)-dependent formamide hydrolase-like protein